MRRVNSCLNCPKRKRIVTDDYIYDCHSDCEVYKAAFERETDIMNKRIKATLPDKEHLRYMVDDKERRRRHGL